MKIVTVYPYLWDRGGAPDLALELARELNTEGKPIVLTNSPSIHECYMNLNVEYKRFSLKNIWRYCFGDEIVVLSHHRKQTSILVLLNLFLFFNKLKIVHVAHNSFDNLKWACFFPKKVIAVSNSVKDNLVRYFGVKEKSIMVIFNGMKDHYLKYLDLILTLAEAYFLHSDIRHSPLFDIHPITDKIVKSVDVRKQCNLSYFPMQYHLVPLYVFSP